MVPIDLLPLNCAHFVTRVDTRWHVHRLPYHHHFAQCRNNAPKSPQQFKPESFRSKQLSIHFLFLWFFASVLNISFKETRRTNAQTIHIRHAYRTPSQSSSFHSPPSRTFDLLHTTLQQNDCTHKNVDLSSLYHHTKFEKNWSVNISI